MRGLIGLAILLFGSMALAQEPALSQAELAKLPPYQRMLKGDDAKKAAELDEKIAAAEAADKMDEAMKLEEEMIALRSRLQGADHWQAVNWTLELKMLRALDSDGRGQLQTARQFNQDALQMAAKSRQAEAGLLLEKALGLRLRVLGEDHPDTATSYSKLAMNLDAQGKAADARPLFEKALDIRRRILGEEHPSTATSYSNVGYNRDALGQAAEAQPFYKRSLDIRLRVLGEDHPDTATSYNNMAYNLVAQGNGAEAQPLYEKALDINRKVLGEDHPETARIYNNLAILLDDQGKVAEAQQLYQKALGIRRRALGEDDPATAQSYASVAMNLDRQGKATEAQPIHQKALDVFRRALGEDHPYTALSYNNLASNLKSQGKTIEAQPLFEKALDVYRRALGEDHPDTATCYSNVAAILEDNGKSALAQSRHQQALDIRRRVLGEDHPDTANSYNNVAHNLNVRGMSSKAQPLYEKALDIRRRVLGEDHPDTVNSLNNLAMNLDHQGKATEARPLHEKALHICVAALGEDHPSTAKSYNNLAMNLDDQGKAGEALLLYQKALDIRRRVLGEEHPDTAGSYNNLAIHLEAQGKAAEAQPLLEKALKIHRQVLGEDHPLTATSHTNLACNLAGLGKTAEAVHYLSQAIFSFEASRLDRAQGIERAVSDEVNPRLLLAAIEQGQSPGEAWNQVELSLSRGLLDQQDQTGSMLTVEEPAELGQVQERLKGLQSQILVLVSRSQRTVEENNELDMLLEDRREVSQKLATFAVASSTRAVAGKEQVQAAIPADSALLLWVDVSGSTRNVQEHFVCVVRREGDPFWARLPGSGVEGKWTEDDTQLPAIVRAGLSATQPPSSLPELLQQLRKQRIEPVFAYLKEHRIKQLFVVGVNLMAGLPVEVIAPEFAVSYVPSGTFLARLPKKPVFENSLLAVGDPIYDSTKDQQVELTTLPSHGLLIQSLAPGGAAEKLGLRSGDVLLNYGDSKIEKIDQLRPAIQKATEAGEKSMAVQFWRLGEDNQAEEKTLQFPVGPLGVILAQDPAPIAISSQRKDEALFASLRGGERWKDLPGTRFEVQRISQLFDSPQVFLDGNANEQAIDKLRQDDELKKFRYLHFATHGKGNNVTAFESKLVLSQDQPTGEPAAGEPWVNNEISAREVLDFWKLNADLVTLSACETGLGKSGSGDGLLGFAQAFLLAGARSVCLSLWEVDDTATALLMHRFYQNLLGRRPGLNEPMPKALALKEAKEWLRNLTNKEATEQAAALMNGVSRGDRGEIKITSRIKAVAPPEEKPFEHPHFWSAFILLGDPE